MLWPHRLWLSRIAGSLLIFLGMFRFCAIFESACNERDLYSSEDLLPSQLDDNYEKNDTLDESGENKISEDGHKYYKISQNE